MKYILNYDDFLNEGLKISLFRLFNDNIKIFRKISDVFFGNDNQIKRKGFAKIFGKNEKIGILKPLGLVATGISLTIIAIYFIMWKHNKTLDTIQPEVEGKLQKYIDLLEAEFSPKELDDLVRLISSDKKILEYVEEMLNGKNIQVNEKYLKNKLTYLQIEKLEKIANSAKKQNILESLDEATAFQILNIPQTSTLKTASISYRKMVNNIHPDKFVNDPVRWNIANTETERLNKAYQAIKDDIAKDKHTGNAIDIDAIGTSFINNQSNKPTQENKTLNTVKFMWDYFRIKSKIEYVITSWLVAKAFSKFKNKDLQELKNSDDLYSKKMHGSYYIFKKIFDSYDEMKLKIFLDRDLNYQNYIQRLNRSKNASDIKKLLPVMEEYIDQKLPNDLALKFKLFNKVCTFYGLFDKSSVTPFSLLNANTGQNYTTQLILTALNYTKWDRQAEKFLLNKIKNTDDSSTGSKLNDIPISDFSQLLSK